MDKILIDLMKKLLIGEREERPSPSPPFME